MRTTTPGRVAGLGDPARLGGVRLGGAGADELDRDHGAAAADLADARVLGLRPLQGGPDHGLDPPRAPGQVLVDEHVHRGQRRGAGDGVAAVGAAQPARVHGVHELGAADDRGQRHAVGQALGHGDEVGPDALVVEGEQVAGAAEPGLDLVGDEQHAVLAAPRGDRGQEPRAPGSTKPPSPCTGSMTTQATWSAPTCVVMLRIARSAACAPVIPSGSRNGYDMAPGTPRPRTGRSRACTASPWPSWPS